jgi:hypothetical protein
MYVPFESLSAISRVWIYQSDRKFSENERSVISEYLKDFTDQWAAHGQALKSSFDIRFDHFIILAVEEDHHSPSGCSIDGSVRVLKTIEIEFGINLFDRSLVAFQKIDGIELLPIQNLKQNYLSGIWNETTLTFNNLVNTIGQLNSEWMVPSGKTWLRRYMPLERITS